MPRILRLGLVVIMCVLMSRIPHAVAAEAAVHEQMISTADAVDRLSRADLENKVRAHLQREEVKRQLAKLGVSPDEISSRLASLSTSELNRLATQMDQARYGGEIVGILIIVLIVLGIIFLAKRV